MNTIRDHLNEVRENIQKACEKAGRSPQEVTLIAVSKTKPLFMLEEAYEAGFHLLRDRRVLLYRKGRRLPTAVRGLCSETGFPGPLSDRTERVPAGRV